MRTLLTVLAAALLLVGSVDCGQGRPSGPAWTRWGITKPAREAGAEAKLAEAHRLLYELKLDSARAAYEGLVAGFPGSAEAHLGLSMALRYSGQTDLALTEARTAQGLDPEAVGVLINYGDMIQPIRTASFEGMSDAERYAESERCLLKAAGSSHPFNAHANTRLWASYMAQGRLADARQQLRELGRKGYYQQPLLDFCRNILVGLEPSAVVFTNGDNDTYPAWVLQVCEGFRPDVTVANVALLSVPAVVKLMKDSLGLPVSLADDEIAGLAPKRDADGKCIELPSQQVVDNIVSNAGRAGRPVYFAVTVSSNLSAPYADRLVAEGLVSRVTEGERAAAADLVRIRENMTGKYRLDWPAQLPPWPANMSPVTRMVAPLALNYASIDVLVAALCESLGQNAEAAAALADAAEWAVRGGRVGTARGLIDGALEHEPDNARAKGLKARLDTTAAVR